MELQPHFTGRERRRRRALGLTVRETLYGVGEASGLHAHPEAYVCLLLSGKFRDEASRATREVGAGETVVRAPGERHRVRFGPEGGRCLMIQVGFSRTELWPALGRPRTASGARLAGPAGAFLRGDLDGTLALEEELADLGFDGAPPPSPGRERLERVRERLTEEHALPLRLSELAAEEGLHPAHLSRAFRRAFGRSMGEYRREVRLGAARARLEEGAPPAAAAAEAGFADQSHLSRIFRAELGLTPGGYRRRFAPSARHAKPVQDGDPACG